MIDSTTYAVDIAFVIDVTGSMRRVLDYVKSMALTFHADLVDAMGLDGKQVRPLRVRILAYRDFNDPRHPALVESPFYLLPEQAEELDAFVQPLQAVGGRDDPESGLEALAAAMNSEWTTEGSHQRHVIAVFTDSSAHPLKHVAAMPAGSPSDPDELTERWMGAGGMDTRAKRLLIFAPPLDPWMSIVDDWAWDQVVHFVSKSGHGLSDSSFEQILATVANSVR